MNNASGGLNEPGGRLHDWVTEWGSDNAHIKTNIPYNKGSIQIIVNTVIWT